MSVKIKEIQIENFKGIRKANIKGLAGLNVFIGKNNSGKSSVAESLTSFFSKTGGFPTEMILPPEIMHYDKEGNAIRESKISILFSLRKSFYKNLDISDDHIQQIKNAHKKGLLVTMDRFNNPGGGDKFYDNYKIATKNRPKDSQKNNNLNRIVLDHLRKSLNSIKAIGPLDGFRSNSYTEKYYNILYGKASDDRNPRDGIATIENNLKNIQGDGGKYRGIIKEFLSRFNAFSAREFSEPKHISQSGLLSEFGNEDEQLEQIKFYCQGDGEIDSLELFWHLDKLSFGNEQENTCQVYIIDQPENHKHVSLQRKFLNLMLKLSQDKQFFICTHSPVFASQYLNPNVSVYLVSKNKDKDSTEILPILKQASTQKIRKELGLINIDHFFCNAILFVEGYTESIVFSALLRFYNENTDSLGIKTINLESNSGAKPKKIKNTLEIIKETDIIPFIALDKKDPGSEKYQKDALRQYPDLFPDPVQYHLWDSGWFINSFPPDLIKKAFINLMKGKDLKSKITIKSIKEEAESGNQIEKYLGKELVNNIAGGKFCKTDFAEYLASEIDKIPRSRKENYLQNEIFKYTKNLTEKLKKINTT